MGNTISTLQTSLLFGALSMLPGNTFPYITLGVASASLTIYAAHHYGPSQRLLRLEDTITATEEILEGAKLDCARDHMTLVRRGRRLLRYVHSVFMLETRVEKYHFQGQIGGVQNPDPNLRGMRQNLGGILPGSTLVSTFASR
ncbi:hypothetical protein B0H17DRAFT_1040333 [Mycena rosella]|uniref:Uncharacterized protein n=1 Tax=Mycena rosella TaxID=1033263 RepID=A0AAD7GS17_MYCRO|nr:hypothetical protein B0H17DRAFT_1040333 [Mycena rosella]